MRIPSVDKRVHGDERPAKKAKGICDASLTSPKKSPAKKSDIALPTSVAIEGAILVQPVTTSARPDGGEGQDLSLSYQRPSRSGDDVDGGDILADAPWVIKPLWARMK